jgi:hypothetical protein
MDYLQFIISSKNRQLSARSTIHRDSESGMTEETKMGLIQGVVDGFIMTVGITPSTPENKRRATIFIATGLLGTVVGIAALFVFVINVMLRR